MLHAVALRGIGFNKDCAAACALEFVGAGLTALRVAAGDDDSGSGGGKGGGHAASENTRRTDDDSHFLGEVEKIGCHKIANKNKSPVTRTAFFGF